MKNIVFVEGVSGAGKSSCASALAKNLRDFGLSAECFLEGDAKSPLDLFSAAYMKSSEYEGLLSQYPDYANRLSKNAVLLGGHALLRYQNAKQRLFPPSLDLFLREREFCYLPKSPVPIDIFTEVFSALWRSYARGERKEADYAIFDGSLISHMSSDLMRNYGASSGRIAAHFGALIGEVHHLSPVVFYLSPSDAGQCLKSARQSRGQPPPTENDLRFWQCRKAMDMVVLEKIPLIAHVIDIGDGLWDEAVQYMTNHLISGACLA